MAYVLRVLQGSTEDTVFQALADPRRCVMYRVEPRGLQPLVDWITHYRAFWTDRVGRLERLLTELER